MKKEYKAPVVQPLGAAAEQTKSGTGTAGDGVTFRQNTGGDGSLQPMQS